jgi:hypothetical protein
MTGMKLAFQSEMQPPTLSSSTDTYQITTDPS